jgi:hypothetical protein
MRRFLLLLFVLSTAVSAASALWPRQIGGYLALFEQHTTVNRGVAITLPAVLTVLLLALQFRLWRSERDLARVRRGLGARPDTDAYGWSSPPGARPAR